MAALLAAACSQDDIASPAESLEQADDVPAPAVPLQQIVFDTFDGGSVPLSEASPELIARLLDAIPPLDAPGYESPDEADWLGPDDVVLGYVDPLGGAWAFPVKILDLHEIVNDELGGQPVLISYCPLCGSGVVYERRLGNDVLTFSNTSALYENDLVMIDRESGTYWWQVAGRGLVGPRTGQALTPLPSQMQEFGEWVREHPNGWVLARPTALDYDRDRFASYPGLVDRGRTPFPISEAVLADDRLPRSTRVVVVELDGEAHAWVIDSSGEREFTISGTRVTVRSDGTGARVEAADSGEPLPSRTAMWFSVVAAFPDVVLVS